MLGLTLNEWALVAFLFVLITAFGWLPRVGEWLGAFIGGVRRGSSQGTSSSSPPSAPGSSSKPPPKEP